MHTPAIDEQEAWERQNPAIAELLARLRQERGGA
jgi:hypothetical protein